MSSKDNDGVWRPVASFDKNEIQWPQSYYLRPPLEGAQPRQWWSHTYYRGPQNDSIRILYSGDRHHSEVIAQGFLNEPVLGFDMEWYWDADKRPRLRDKVALIQIACERKIGLFHIARHDGDTTEELISPSLRRIIESVHIIKTGVGILNADFSRLKNYFRLEPRGAMELSHLNSLVTFGLQNPDRVTTRLRALSKLTEDHLGLPLRKGTVRMSDWSLPLDDEQKAYAADDAYVGYMLFHRMNALRLNMTPIPPLPKLAESYLPFTMPKIMPLQLEPIADGPEAVGLTARQFFTPAKPQLKGNEVTRENAEKVETHSLPKPRDVRPVGKAKERKPVINTSKEPEISHELYEKLVSHRRQLAKTKGVSAFIIATNKILEGLAQHRPTTKAELMNICGIGKHKVSLYGDEWLGIISSGLQGHPKESPKKNRVPLQPKSPNEMNVNETNHQKPLGATSDLADELYQRLYDHRKAQADVRGCRPYVVATNLVLEALARERPDNRHKLLAIEGIEKIQVTTYGPAWLRIIRGFMADHEPRPLQPPISEIPAGPHPDDFFQQPLPQPDDQPSKCKRIKQVGRSKELVLNQPAPSTGLSFQFSETNLSVDEVPAERDNGACYDKSDESLSKPSMGPSASPRLKRKRVECTSSPCEETNTAALPLNSTTIPDPSKVPIPSSVNKAPHPESLSPQHKILRNKLDAYVKSVIWLMNPKPTQPIVSEDTLHCLVTTLPRTLDEFHKVPGIERFFQACQGVKKDLWLTFSTWTRTSGLVPSS